MFLLVPLGSDQSVRRLPWFTIIVCAICFVVQVHETIAGPSAFEAQEAAEKASVECRAQPQRCDEITARLDQLDAATIAPAQYRTAYGRWPRRTSRLQPISHK